MTPVSLTPHEAVIDLGSRFTALSDTAPPAETGAAARHSPATAEWPPRIAVHDSLAAVEATWRTLEAQSDCTAFQTYDWVAAWQTHVGTRTGTVPAIVVGAADDGRPLFLFALGIESRRGARQLTWLATDVCDYNAPILARDFAATLDADRFRALWKAVLTCLAADPRFRFDYIDLQRMPEKIGAMRDPFLALGPDLHPSGAHACTLTGDWETFYAAKRSSSTRKTARKQFKQIQKHGPVSFDDVAEASERRRTLAVLMEQKAQSLARMGAENFFARPGYRDFYRAVIADPALQQFRPHHPAERRPGHRRHQRRAGPRRHLLFDPRQLRRRPDLRPRPRPRAPARTPPPYRRARLPPLRLHRRRRALQARLG